MIHLEEITPDNWRIPLQVAPSQKTYAADRATLLARAYAYRNARSCAFLIYADETPVGMGLYYDCADMQCYIFSQLFIDERYQGNGYGLAAAELVLDNMKHDNKYNKVILCYIEGTMLPNVFMKNSASQKQGVMKMKSLWKGHCYETVMRIKRPDCPGAKQEIWQH